MKIQVYETFDSTYLNVPNNNNIELDKSYSNCIDEKSLAYNMVKSEVLSAIYRDDNFKTEEPFKIVHSVLSDAIWSFLNNKIFSYDLIEQYFGNLSDCFDNSLSDGIEIIYYLPHTKESFYRYAKRFPRMYSKYNTDISNTDIDLYYERFKEYHKIALKVFSEIHKKLDCKDYLKFYSVYCLATDEGNRLFYDIRDNLFSVFDVLNTRFD